MKLAELAGRLGAELEGDGELEILSLAPIDEAGPDQLSFVASPQYRRYLASTLAGAVVLGPDEDGAGLNVLRCGQPYAAFVKALELFDTRCAASAGIHPTAIVGEGARLGDGASVGAYVVIGERVEVGADAVIHPHVVIYPDVRIGARFTAHAGAVVRESVTIGDDVTLQPGVIVGGDGFGFLPTGGPVPAPIRQIGTVRLGNDVDVGANSTIDRATVGTTRIERGVKLDNLVMIAHGCTVGEGTMLAAQFGVAGSSRIGAGVMAGGQAGVSGHVHVGDGARMAAHTGAAADVEAGATVAGSPAVAVGLWRRYSVLLRRLPELFRRVRALERGETPPDS